MMSTYIGCIAICSISTDTPARPIDGITFGDTDPPSGDHLNENILHAYMRLAADTARAWRRVNEELRWLKHPG